MVRRAGLVLLWAVNAVLIGAVSLSVLGVLVAVPRTMHDPALSFAQWFAALLMSLVVNITFGAMFVLPFTVVVLALWTVVARRAPQLERSPRAMLIGLGIVAVLYAGVGLAMRSLMDADTSAGFLVMVAAAAWSGLVLPRRWFDSLRPGALLQ